MAKRIKKKWTGKGLVGRTTGKVDLLEKKWYRSLIWIAIVLVFIWAVCELLSIQLSTAVMTENYRRTLLKKDAVQGVMTGEFIVVNGVNIPKNTASEIINLPKGVGDWFVLEEDGSAVIAKQITRREGLDICWRSFTLSLVTFIVTVLFLTRVVVKDNLKKRKKVLIGHWLFCIYECLYVGLMTIVYVNAFNYIFGANADRLWVIGALLSLTLIVCALYGQYAEGNSERLQPRRH